MEIKRVNFLKSSQHLGHLPPPRRPEYAFCGRSNVGKSSLINALTRKRDLAKTSSMPGKTQLINHFDVDDRWYLVDLPGYGFAKVKKTKREGFHKMIRDYLEERQSLGCCFALVDLRLEPQENDLEFIEFLGSRSIPFAIVFTKADKLTPRQIIDHRRVWENRLREDWEELPPIFVTSSETGEGRQEVLNYIGEINAVFYGEKPAPAPRPVQNPADDSEEE